ncbi:MAG: T9SS type A sorting domain-containing protein [Candidatus Hydrothermia bacterium]|nr:T9SS type A sorting domain-containing protein [Candidatus Hydrothermia bacterium]
MLYITLNLAISEKCLTPQIIENFQKGNFHILARPTLSGPEQTIQTTHFIIHYTTSGSDAVSPAYAESVAVFAEFSYQKEVNDFGWFAPPPDYNQGGDNRYDIYIKNLGSGVLGYTAPENNYGGYGTEGATSYIVIGTNIDSYYGIGVLKVTVAHEFHHAIQFAYTAYDDAFFYENTSTWMEDMVYDDVNDYIGYLSIGGQSPLTVPHYKINTFQNSGLYQYAGAIFPYFIYEYLGNNQQPMKDIWYQMGINFGNNTLFDIFDVLLNNYSKPQDTILSYYAIWRFFTGTRWNDGVNYRYSEGNLYPTSSLLRNVISYPVSDSNQNQQIQNPGGANFIRLSSYNGVLRIVIKFKQCSNCAKVYLLRIPGPVIDDITGNGDSIDVSFNFSGYNYSAIIVVSKQLGGPNIIYRYKIMPVSEIVENVNSDYKIIVQKRNVKVLTNDKNYEFKLFDLSGKLVENKNLKNGVYFYVLKIKGKTYKGKILIK